MRGLRLLAAAGVLALASRASGESLAEAAAREQARREASRSKAGPSVVVHEEQLKQASGRIANDPAIAPAVKVPPAQPPMIVTSGALLTEQEVSARGFVAAAYVVPPPSAQDDIRSREAYWRGEARRRRQQAEAAEDVLKAIERWSDPTYAGADRPSCPIVSKADQRKARAEAARARAELRSLDEEARVGGALPGWIRE